jgi:IS5 family transposase
MNHHSSVKTPAGKTQTGRAKNLHTVNELLTERGLLLKVGTAIDATNLAPTSTKTRTKARDPEIHSSKKGNH